MAGKYEQQMKIHHKLIATPNKNYTVVEAFDADHEVKEADAEIADLREKCDKLAGERDTLKARVEELEKVIQTAMDYHQGRDGMDYHDAYGELYEALTPQPADYFEQPTQGTAPAITPRKSTKRIVGKVKPADTPCPECGTVGGGGTVPGGEKPYPLMNTRENKPCPRCGA